jgi:hypothetical protein
MYQPDTTLLHFLRPYKNYIEIYIMTKNTDTIAVFVIFVVIEYSHSWEANNIWWRAQSVMPQNM